MTWPKPINPYDVPNTSYMYRLQEPSYPVINKDPDFLTAAANVRSENWTLVAAATAASFVIGYYLGSKHHYAKTSAYFSAFMTGKTAGVWATYDSANRLMGYRENSREVVKNVPAALVPESY